MQAHVSVLPQLFLAQSASEAGLTEGCTCLSLRAGTRLLSRPQPCLSHTRGRVGIAGIYQVRPGPELWRLPWAFCSGPLSVPLPGFSPAHAFQKYLSLEDPD